MSKILIKSKYNAEFKRYSIKDDFGFEKFEEIIKTHHSLDEIPFLIFYTDPLHGDLLPINNDENFAKAKSVQKSILKIVLQAKGESYNDLNDLSKKRNFFDNLNSLLTQSNTKTPKLEIKLQEDFHQVSSIIDADKLEKTLRRVKITKHGSDKPLGFYIRDGYSVRLTPHGLQRVPSIFISRVLPGGLAESTGLLAVNDEVLEVNGIDVLGKSIEQVTDMMVANASNLILTIKPASQNHLNDSFISTRSNTNSLQRIQTPQRNSHQYDLHSLQRQQMPSQSKPMNMLQNNNVQQNNVLQTNLQHNSIQSSNFNNHLQPTPNGYLHQYSSLRNQPNNVRTPVHHNNSFNYSKSSLSVHLHNPQQENKLIQNQLNLRQSLDQYNSYMKMSQSNIANQQLSNQQALNLNQAHQPDHHQQNIYQNVRVNSGQVGNYEENGAVGYDANKYSDHSASNEDIIERLKQSYYVDENEYEDDEDDQVLTYNFEELKLRNVYQNNNMSNNQGLNVN